MDYYRIKQSNQLSNSSPFASSERLQNAASSSKASYIERASGRDGLGYVPLSFMDYPVFVISPELKKLFEAYQEGASFRVFFTKGPDGKGQAYYIYQPFILDCLAPSAKVNSGKSVKTLELDSTAIGAHKVFQIGGLLARYLIVDFEILELMLCNDIYPFSFEKVAVL